MCAIQLTSGKPQVVYLSTAARADWQASSLCVCVVLKVGEIHHAPPQSVGVATGIQTLRLLVIGHTTFGDANFDRPHLGNN